MSKSVPVAYATYAGLGQWAFTVNRISTKSIPLYDHSPEKTPHVLNEVSLKDAPCEYGVCSSLAWVSGYNTAVANYKAQNVQLSEKSIDCQNRPKVILEVPTPRYMIDGIGLYTFVEMQNYAMDCLKASMDTD
jgi:hypothetical protein